MTRMNHEWQARVEAEFQSQDERLAAFYKSSEQTFSVDEEDNLYPILNSLTPVADQYEELEVFAEGAEKVLSRAVDRRLNRQVAMARPVRRETKEDQERFLREAYLVANLAHPNIMPVYGVGLDSNHIPFFTMELLSGESLELILKKLRSGDADCQRCYSLNQLMRIYLKVCDAIAYAHSRGVLHLDIKPGNIQVGPFGEVLVFDWGLAKVLSEKDSLRSGMPGELDGDLLNELPRAGTIRGSLGFMAPEQITEGAEVSEQTDIYALGALLYQLLTLRLPVEGGTDQAILRNTRAGAIIPPRRRGRGVFLPTGLCEVALKALALEPERRYAAVAGVKGDVDRYLAGHPTDAERAGVITRLVLFMKRHSHVAAVFTLSLMLISVVVIFNSSVIRREKAAAEVATLEARDNLEMYLQEHSEVLQLNSDLADAITLTMKSSGYRNTTLTLRIFERALSESMSPERYQEIMLQKGIIHFIRQEFQSANQCFDVAKGRLEPIGEIVSLSRKYGRIYPEDSDSMRRSDQQLADLINDYKVKNLSMNQIINYTYLHHIVRGAVGTPEDYMPLAQAMLEHLNSPLQSASLKLELTRNKNGRHLDLSGTPYSQYRLKLENAYNTNVLAPLSLYGLDISDTPIRSIEVLRGLEVSELRIAGLELSAHNFLFILRQSGIQTLVIDAGAFADVTMQKLHENFEVIEE